jgi:UDP-N-acetylglucosamine acyltransferase
MRILKFPKNLIIGKNNYIEPGVKIHENVIIGDNNKIYDGSVIYPNTKIGNDNIILNNNILGEHPVESHDIFKEKIFNGLEIGNNNMFHVENIIFNGYHRKTKIGNNNKILTELNMGHDTHIQNNVTIYPRVTTGGLTTIMNNSSLGMGSLIQQKSVLGEFSMIGMGNIASHNIFPFYIYFNQKYLRLNKIKIPEDLLIEKYDEKIRMLIKELKNNDCDEQLVEKYKLPKNIEKYIYNFLDIIEIKKI